MYYTPVLTLQNMNSARADATDCRPVGLLIGGYRANDKRTIIQRYNPETAHRAWSSLIDPFLPPIWHWCTTYDYVGGIAEPEDKGGQRRRDGSSMGRGAVNCNIAPRPIHLQT